MKFIRSVNYDKTRLLEVLSLDDIVYDKKLTGTFESVSSRYKSNEEMFIFAVDESDVMRGYICFFPISDELSNKITSESKIFDDNITPEDVTQYSKSKINNIYVISVAVFPEYRGKGIGFNLAKEMFEVLANLSNSGYEIGKIYATAKSVNGERLLSKFNFHIIKEYQGNEKLMEFDFIGYKYMDLYLFLPVELKKEFKDGEKQNNFLEILEKTWQAEINSIINERIERLYLGVLSFCPEDDYGCEIDTKKLKANLYLSSYRNIGTLIIEFQSISHDPTSILDQSSRNGLKVIAEENIKSNLCDYLSSRGLKVLGNSNHLLVSGGKINPYFRQFVLYGESYFNRIGSRIVSEDAMRESTKNIAQYEFAEIYCSGVGIIFEFSEKTPSSSYTERLETSILMLYIYEILALKLASIRLLQNTITYEFDNSPKPSIDIIEELIDNYGKYIVLFEYNYKYHLAKCLSDKIDKQFKIQEMREEYHANIDQLNRIVTIRSQKVAKDFSNKQDSLFRVISLFTFLLSINNVISLFIGVDFSSIKDSIAFVISITLWGIAIIYLVVLLIRKKLKKLSRK